MIVWLSVALIVMGGFFFLAGTVGILRFPDVYTRLHALTKADNLGLGLTALGLALQAESLPAVLKLGLIWSLALMASSTACYLVSNSAVRGGVRPWQTLSAPGEKEQ